MKKTLLDIPYLQGPFEHRRDSQTSGTHTIIVSKTEVAISTQDDLRVTPLL